VKIDSILPFQILGVPLNKGAIKEEAERGAGKEEKIPGVT
jgi:hypothetical protein